MQRARSLIKSRPLVLLAGLAGIALIAIADRRLNNAIPLGLLYLAPVVAISTVLQRWQIPVLGALCTFIAEWSDAFPWTFAEGIPRDALYFFAYTGAGLYVSEALHRHRAEQTHRAAMEQEMEARRGVEEQLRLVVQNSSIAIVTSDETGTVLHANAAAEQLFRGESAGENAVEGEASLVGSSLVGSSLGQFMPSLARVQVGRQGWKQLRTMMQCQGFRAGREPFLADVWFSTYTTSGGGRLTAMIVDSSLEMRDRENANLEQVLAGSKIAVGALSHEIRNICAAISVVHQNLIQQNQAQQDRAPERPAPAQLQEFDALRQLVAALERLASVELSLVKRQAGKVKLDDFLRELYIVIHSSLRDAGIALQWRVEPELPEVWADQQSLLQVFLNLVRNAEHALGHRSDACMSVCASRRPNGVQIVVEDNGPGVDSPEQLFRPFADGPVASGFGLYLSRAMLRSFHGDLHHQPSAIGARFTVDLVAVRTEE